MFSWGPLAAAVAGGYGWVRLWGWGVAWKPRHARAYFSERHGYVRYYRVGPWRVRVLRRGRT